MIDHVAARRLAATAIDLPLEADEATELERHLATCPACRIVSSALARDAAALRHLDLGPVPIAVRADVAIAADRGRSGPVGRWGALVVLAALLVVALGSGALAGVGGGTAADDLAVAVAAAPVDWRTGLIDLSASDLWVQVGDRHLVGASDAAVKAAMEENSRTLEAISASSADKVGLRLSIVSVEGRWLVKGVQVWIDGLFGQWLDGHGPLIGSEVGAGPLGDVDLDLVNTSTLDLTVGATLHIRDLSVVLGPVPVPPDQPVPAAPNQAVPQPATPTP
jgi:predicted anti-sigma-YlaC factor YlaD